MRIKIFKAGEEGYLYLDLLIALFIVSITLIGLFTGGRTVLSALRRMETEYRQTVEEYEKILMGELEV